MTEFNRGGYLEGGTTKVQMTWAEGEVVMTGDAWEAYREIARKAIHEALRILPSFGRIVRRADRADRRRYSTTRKRQAIEHRQVQRALTTGYRKPQLIHNGGKP